MIRRKVKKLLHLLAAVAISMVVLVGCAGLFQQQLIFFPESIDEHEDLSWTGASEEVFIDADDGARIHGLLFEADGPSKGVILYFHGNAGSVASWYQVADHLTGYDVDVLLIDYRTYGKSTGDLSEEGLYLDGDASYRWLRQRGYDPEAIVVHGRSLGSAVATRVAADHPVGAVILETPFTDLSSLASDIYFIPVPDWLLQYRLDNQARAESIDVPTWIVHGTDDELVPLEHSRRLYDALDDPRRLTVIDGGTHNNLMSFTLYRRQLDAFLTDVLGEADDR